MPVAQTQIRQVWLYLTSGDLPLTGMVSPADVELILKRDTGTATVTASETVTWVETATAGFYDIVFTPVNNGRYTLYLRELNAGSMGRRYWWTWEVDPAGAQFLPAFTDAFCSLGDVERWLQQTIDSTVGPNDTETAAFAVSRAAVLMSLCAGLGMAVTPLTVAAGSRLKTLLRDANAIGAALDYTAAQILSVQPSRSDRFDYFERLWIAYVGGPQPGFVTEVVGRIEKEIGMNLVSLGTDQILSGDTLPATSSSPPTDAGIQIGMGTVY